MLPIPDGSYVTGEFVQNWLQIKNKQAYIIVTLDDGVVFKVIENKIKQDNKLVLHSLNPLFDSYEVEVSQIREMWRFVNYISQEIPPSNEMKTETLSQNLKALQQEVKQIQTSLKL